MLSSSIIRRSLATKTSSSSSSMQKKHHQQATITKLLYRQILKWAKTTGSSVPFGPIPPFILASPEVNEASLQALSLAHSHSHSNSNSNSNLEQETTGEEENNRYKRLAKLLPFNSIVDSSRIILPIENAESVRIAAKLSFALNKTDKLNLDLDIQKELITSGFAALKSLNELTAILDERKLKREKHRDRTGVLFHLGQVVQHKTERWRAVVTKWDKKEDGVGTHNASSSKTSLTSKSYGVEEITNTGGTDTDTDDNDNQQQKRQQEVMYTLYLDEGDAILSGGTRIVGSRKATQHELEPVRDIDLQRVRSSMTNTIFDSFDLTTGSFQPNRVLKFEYPADDPAAIAIKGDATDNAAGAGAGADADVQFAVRKHENAKTILRGVKEIATRLHRIILDSASCPKSRQLVFLSDMDERLTEIINGENLQTSADILSSLAPSSSMSSSATSSSYKVAMLHLNALTNVALRLMDTMYERRTATIHKHRIKYPLGSVVKHKKYGFRGIVVSWDPYPNTDVSRWDGLQDLKGDANKMPFYHIIADENDTKKAFGQPRRFRYVCEENLDLCVDPEEMEGLDVSLNEDEGWTLSNPSNSDEMVCVPPAELQFRHAESFAEEDEKLINDCMQSLVTELSDILTNVRDEQQQQQQVSGTNNVFTLKDLYTLLENTESVDDAFVVEEFIKEIWKSHRILEARWGIDDGTKAILRGDKQAALKIYEEIISTHDAEFCEAFNKKATVHYMLGDMKKSVAAAEVACKMESKHFQAYAGMGLAFNDECQYQKATKYFRKSLKLDPWSPVSSRLCICLDTLNRLDLEEQKDDD